MFMFKPWIGFPVAHLFPLLETFLCWKMTYARLALIIKSDEQLLIEPSDPTLVEFRPMMEARNTSIQAPTLAVRRLAFSP